MNILITGSDGYIGNNLYEKLNHKYSITKINRKTFDLCDYYSTKEWFADKFFDVIIHTAIKGGSRLSNDNANIIDDNISMYYNLLKCRENYNKFINIGSGAEIFASDSYYGLSKKIINTSISNKSNFYSLRIYGLFNENELETRFIKSNINRYLKKNDIIIYKNKLMDFIYFDDFLKILTTYIETTNNLEKNIDCVYEKKYSLLDIANIINELDNHRVKINIIDNSLENNYIGNYTNICNINFVGLKQGITNTYRKLQNEKDMVCAE